MDALYLRVRNWEKFQHYQNRPNPPHWIKSYPALLDDYAFRQLPEVEQGRLMKVWLLAGKLRNRIPYDARYVAEVIGAKKINLDMFVSLGWLELVDEHENVVDPESVGASTPVSTPRSRPSSRASGDVVSSPEEKRTDETRDRSEEIHLKAVGSELRESTASDFKIPTSVLKEIA